MSSNAQNAADAPTIDADRAATPPDTSPDVASWHRRAWGRIPSHWKFIAGLFVGSKIVLMLVGLVAIHANDMFLSVLPSDELRKYMEGAKQAVSTHATVRMWFAWDALRYWELARGSLPAHMSKQDLQFAFPPLYPLLGRGTAVLLGGRTGLALLVVSNAAFVCMLYYAYRLGERLFGDADTARRFTRYLVLLPAAFIFQAPFTESLFLCLTLAGFYYAERSKWLLVGIIGYFLALTRSYGFLVTIPLALVLLQQGRYQLRPKALWSYIRTGWPLVLVPAGWATFMAYSRWRTGDWFRYQHVQEQFWNLTMQNPFATLWQGLARSAPANVAQTWFAVGCLVLSVIALRYVKPAYAVYGLLLTLMPLTVGGPSYRSLIRYLVVVFPVALVFAIWGRRRAIDTYLTAALAVLQGALWVTWLAYWTTFII